MALTIAHVLGLGAFRTTSAQRTSASLVRTESSNVALDQDPDHVTAQFWAMVTAAGLFAVAAYVTRVIGRAAAVA